MATLRFIAQDRERKPSTIRDYRSALNAHLLPAFGDRQLESITVDEIEAWRGTLGDLSNRTKNKLLIHFRVAAVSVFTRQIGRG